MEYRKETNRINVQFVDYDTEEVLFEVPNRNWMNLGELFTDRVIDDIAQRELKGRKLPKKILILANVVANLEK